MKQSMQVLTSEGTDEWYTPPWLIEMVREVLGGIDLDPASSDVAQGWIKAARYYTAETLLQEPWSGRVFLNPPYSDTPGWVTRLSLAYERGDVSAALLLVNSAPGYAWWEQLWRQYPVCMVERRMRFWTPEGREGGQAKKGQTVAYYGADLDRFHYVFSPIGRIIPPA